MNDYYFDSVFDFLRRKEFICSHKKSCMDCECNIYAEFCAFGGYLMGDEWAKEIINYVYEESERLGYKRKDG